MIETIKKKKIVLAIGGSSGSIYAQLLIDFLSENASLFSALDIVFSTNAETVWEHELGEKLQIPASFKVWKRDDFRAPFASGSAKYDAMVVCPCSMGLLGRIASGVSNDLMTRAADVMLKERKKLILVPRDTPFNLIHIRNMETVTLAGGIICPAIPSFYSQPKSIREVASTVVFRVLDLLGVENKGFEWGQ